MTEYNQRNKNFYNNNLTISESSENSGSFLVIAISILGSLIWGVISIIICKIISSFLFPYDGCFNLPYYALTICFTAIGVGNFISYGAKQNKYNNKMVLFILIFLCSFLVYLISAFTMFTVINPYLNILSIPICLVGLVIGGFISYKIKQNNYLKKHLLLIPLLLFSFLAYLIFYIVFMDFDQEEFQCLLWNIGFVLFIVLGIGGFISYGIKQNRHLKNHLIFKLILLCLTFSHFMFNFAAQDSAPYNGYNGKSFFLIRFVHFLLGKAGYEPFNYFPSNFYPRNGTIEGIMSTCLNHIYIFYHTIFYHIGYHTITLEKSDINPLIQVINIQAWVIIFIITVFITCIYTIFTCPWLLEGEKNNWLQLFIKKLQRRTE